jgi:hypothetical protein
MLGSKHIESLSEGCTLQTRFETLGFMQTGLIQDSRFKIQDIVWLEAVPKFKRLMHDTMAGQVTSELCHHYYLSIIESDQAFSSERLIGLDWIGWIGTGQRIQVT